MGLSETKTATILGRFKALPEKIIHISAYFYYLPADNMTSYSLQNRLLFQIQNIIILREILIHHAGIVLDCQLYYSLKYAIFNTALLCLRILLKIKYLEEIDENCVPVSYLNKHDLIL